MCFLYLLFVFILPLFQIITSFDINAVKHVTRIKDTCDVMVASETQEVRSEVILSV